MLKCKIRIFKDENGYFAQWRTEEEPHEWAAADLVFEIDGDLEDKENTAKKIRDEGARRGVPERDIDRILGPGVMELTR